jgi:hypothetical protein
LEHRCLICGRELEGREGKTPPTYHEDCKRYRNYLDAAFRALDRIEFDRSATGLERSRMLRQELISTANQMPIERHNQRDEKGRFRAQEA